MPASDIFINVYTMDEATYAKYCAVDSMNRPIYTLDYFANPAVLTEVNPEQNNTDNNADSRPNLVVLSAGYARENPWGYVYGENRA